MIMTYLKFPDRLMALAYLGFDEFIPPIAMFQGQRCDFDVLFGTGVVFERTGGTDDAPIMTEIAGFHVNIWSPEPLDIDATYVIVPNHPICVFSGARDDV